MSSLFDASTAEVPPTLTVGELSARIQRLTASAFPGDLWVSGQIRNLKRSNAGHVYFELAEPTPMGIDPRLSISVALLEPERQYVNRQLTKAGGAVRMADGIEVRIGGRVRWYEKRGSLQFKMSDIDPAFTLGRLEVDREQLLKKLAAEDLLDANARLPVPLVPLRVGLITSRGSAAEADVRHELEASGLAFDVRFVDARTQGAECASSVIGALRRLSAEDLDVVLLVRGGGARTDLAGFDNEDVARAIAAMSVPVFTGIGHEVDRSVADEVAHSAHKTPTAAAGAVIATVREFLGRLDAAWVQARRAALSAAGHASDRLDRRAGRLARAATRTLVRHDQQMTGLTIRVMRGADRVVDRADAVLDRSVAAVGPRSYRALDRADERLALIEARVAVHDPAAALAKGWSITTTADGRPIRDVSQLTPGDELLTRLASGAVHSTVTATDDRPAEAGQSESMPEQGAT